MADVERTWQGCPLAVHLGHDIRNTFVLPDGLLIFPDEGDDERWAGFSEPFGDLRDDGIFFDRRGHAVGITRKAIVGLEHYSADELRRAGRTIADPDEIRVRWLYSRDGEQVWTHCYWRVEGEVSIMVTINRLGWAFCTTDDSHYPHATARDGELQYHRESL